MTENQDWHDPVAESYAATIAHKVPGYQLLHELTIDVLETELKGTAPRILTVGAGGGEEIINMLQRKEDWLITGVDPSSSMLNMAKRRVAQLQVEARVTWHETSLDKVSAEPVYDAAVNLLVIHFVEKRLPFLKEIARRLQSDAPFVLAFIGGEMKSHAFQQELHMLSLFMQRHGLEKDMFTSFQNRLGCSTHPVPEEEIREELIEAGFEDIRPYFQAGMIKGLVCKRGHSEADEK
ncbi:class I SAM-dependent methyltransferase [Bacillus pumilus]|uniref:Class I SAM-dependent methyltransferase n=1 Tax=Bacillus pumilus TaxID=1408 RepID=A0AAD2PSN8_BACPU|nr:class I SAM-dependent methyltransferase [Bacillus pumilus]AVM25942.1 class I SAM-dependent methyltransferase [Bacillus pumilus]TYS31305.1 class I SAM-dependent methyltransferase [Bacillus pumilus]TYS41134.1 class I SAM-dependent methyltransferase [Bacillus pumilus]TYS46454.1 class I SAM-dependent methyltransferase [Bacillus pumilus]